MRLQVLVGQLLEIIQDLLLNNRCQTLDLFDEDAFAHLQLADVGGAGLSRGFADLATAVDRHLLFKRVLFAEGLVATFGGFGGGRE